MALALMLELESLFAKSLLLNNCLLFVIRQSPV